LLAIVLIFVFFIYRVCSQSRLVLGRENSTSTTDRIEFPSSPNRYWIK